MAIRIAIHPVPDSVVPPAGMTPDPGSNSTATPHAEPDGDDKGDKKVPQQNAGYMGPEKGPFRCGSCQYWQEPNACDIVSGSIDKEACCNNFTPGDNSEDADTNDPYEDNGEVDASADASAEPNH